MNSARDVAPVRECALRGPSDCTGRKMAGICPGGKRPYAITAVFVIDHVPPGPFIKRAFHLNHSSLLRLMI